MQIVADENGIDRPQSGCGHRGPAQLREVTLVVRGIKRRVGHDPQPRDVDDGRGAAQDGNPKCQTLTADVPRHAIVLPGVRRSAQSRLLLRPCLREIGVA